MVLRRAWLLVIALAAVALGTPLVPYLFPPSRDILGVSAGAGFNNTVAYLWYVAAVILAGVALARLLPAKPALTLPSLDGFGREVPWRVVGIVAALHVVAFTALFLYKGRFVFSEGLYFQALLHRMTLGDVPYVDFSYYYGPLILYPGHWLGRVFGLEVGYGIWFVVNYVIGLYLLAVILAAFLHSRRAVTWWFLLLAVGLVNPFTGVMFTFTRYLIATLAFLLAARLFRTRRWDGFPTAALCLSAAILYGFEVASLSIGGILALAAAYVLRGPIDLAIRGIRTLVGASIVMTDGYPAVPRPSEVLARCVALLGAGLAVAAASFYALDSSGRALAGFADASVGFLSGAHNQPVYLNFLFLTFATISVLALAVVAQTVASTSSRVLAGMIGAYAALALVAQRASFSATDYNHLIFFGLPALLLALSGLEHSAGLRARAVRIVASAVLIVGYVLPMQSYQISQLFPSLFVSRGAASTAGPAVSVAPTEEILMRVVKEAGVDHPYVMYGLDYYSLPVYRRLGLRFAGYDTILNSARTPALVDLQIDRVRKAKAYVVMTTADYEGRSGPRPSDPFWNAYTNFTGAVMPGSDVQRLNYESLRMLQDQFFDFVRREYRPAVTADGIVVLKPAVP